MLRRRDNESVPAVARMSVPAVFFALSPAMIAMVTGLPPAKLYADALTQCPLDVVYRSPESANTSRTRSHFTALPTVEGAAVCSRKCPVNAEAFVRLHPHCISQLGGAA